MAAAITSTSVSERLVPMTVSGTGFANDTAYIVQVTTPMGHTGYRNVLSDGSGAWSFTYVPNSIGQFTFDARPTTEYLGTTTAAATITGRCK